LNHNPLEFTDTLWG